MTEVFIVFVIWAKGGVTHQVFAKKDRAKAHGKNLVTRSKQNPSYFNGDQALSYMVSKLTSIEEED